MGTVAIGKNDFKQQIEKGGITFIDWWADWCGPCKAFAPTYEKVAVANPDITFAKIDTEAEQELAGSFQIRSIPTLMIFRDGILLFAQPGALPQSALEELVGKVRELDMNHVRAEMAKHEAEHAHGEHGHDHDHGEHGHDHDHGEHGHDHDHGEQDQGEKPTGSAKN